MQELRMRGLRQLEILDTPEEETFDELTELASLICNCPISLVSLVRQLQTATPH
jgi:hypothetical protein